MKKLVAILYGLVCHGFFATAIVSAFMGLYTGLDSGLGQLHGPAALIANTLLLIQFPLLHSYFLSQRGKKWLERLAPWGLGKDLFTTIYATIASIQLGSVFFLWSPSQHIWWEAQGGMRIFFNALYLGSWAILIKTLSDAGIALQTGYLGWSSVARGKKPHYQTFQPKGSFKYCRQPVYLAFSLILWTSPIFTPEKFILAVAWTIYCIVGPLFKESRYLHYYGDKFKDYQATVAYWLPITPLLKRFR